MALEGVSLSPRHFEPTGIDHKQAAIRHHESVEKHPEGLIEITEISGLPVSNDCVCHVRRDLRIDVCC